jgi:hypothetical protein
MSHPYILVNPQTPKQFAALVDFLKQTECPFQVPEDQHFDTSHLCANQDMLDGAIQDAFRTGLLRPEDTAIFGEEVEDYTTHKVIRGVQLFKVPKEAKDFWGSEYLNADGFITLESAQHRLTKYAIVHSLLLPYEMGFTTNEELRSVLKCDKTDIHFAALPVVLLSMNDI